MALTVTQLGMSLVQMGKPDESVRFLDDIDITMSLENKQAMALQRTSIEIDAKPIIFRASQRDINLILSIVTRASQLASQSSISGSTSSPANASKTKATTTYAKSEAPATEKPHLIMSTEKVSTLNSLLSRL